MTLPNGAYWEPLHLGDVDLRVKVFALVREPGEPPRIEGFLTAVGPDGVLTVDAIMGEQGEKGESAPIIRRQWPPLSDPADLPDVATLDETDDGRAWYIAGQWHIYDEGEFHVVQGSIPGPPGVTPEISVTAEQVEADDPVTYGPITVTASGPTSSPNFHLEIPGVPGAEGPAASIASASDVDDTTIGDNEVGQILAVTEVDVEGNPTFGVVDPAFLSPQIYTLPHNSFIDHTGSEGRFLIGSLDIPAKTFDYYPDVDGFGRLARSGFLSSVQCEIEVRIGTTGAGTGETEQLCGLAPYDPTIALLDAATIAHIHPCWSDTLNPSFALDPDTGAGRVEAGTAVTFYVFIHKIAGTGSYQFTKANTGAHLRVQLNPIA
jgi:hypothetical protein